MKIHNETVQEEEQNLMISSDEFNSINIHVCI